MSWSAILGIAGAVLAACSFTTAGIALGVARRWQARHAALEADFAALRREFERVAAISARTGRRVQRVEHEYSEVADRVDVVESRAPTAPGSESFDQAIESARLGADADTLAAKFGLSSGEAELVARMHGRQKSA